MSKPRWGEEGEEEGKRNRVRQGGRGEREREKRGGVGKATSSGGTKKNRSEVKIELHKARHETEVWFNKRTPRP